MNDLVFVYGTLRKGCCFNLRLLGGALHLGPAVTVNPYRMSASGGIPFVDKVPVSRIVGDVYQVSKREILDLDHLEHHPHWYRRELIPVEVTNLTNGPAALVTVQAWLYFNTREISVNNNKLTVPSGDFMDYLKAHGDRYAHILQPCP
jgi:gamma-glutamylaminecyclotransferase